MDASIERYKITSSLLIGNNADFGKIINEGTQVSVIKKEKGFDFVVMVLGLIINGFCQAFNVKQNMTTEQIADLSIQLTDEYWSYKLEDFIVFFNLAKKGRYGKIYDRIDAPTIFQMFSEYDKDRDEGIIQLNISYTQTEKYAREKSTNEFDKITTLAGAMSEVKKLAEQNRDKINKLKP